MSVPPAILPRFTMGLYGHAGPHPLPAHTPCIPPAYPYPYGVRTPTLHIPPCSTPCLPAPCPAPYPPLARAMPFLPPACPVGRRSGGGRYVPPDTGVSGLRIALRRYVPVPRGVGQVRDQRKLCKAAGQGTFSDTSYRKQRDTPRGMCDLPSLPRNTA